MPLVSVHDVLTHATENHYGVAAINVANYETIKWAVAAANQERVPLIIQFWPGFDVMTHYIDMGHIASIAKQFAQESEVPIAVHLDHSWSYDIAVTGIKKGFPSVMVDGSALPYEENVALTKSVADVARVFGVDIEAELGHVGSGSSIDDITNSDHYTNVAQAAEFVEKTGCGSLAVAVGNAHGAYKVTPNLDFDRIKALRKAVSVPLVMHGCSDIPHEQLQEAVRLGMSKFNIATEYFRACYRSACEVIDLEKKDSGNMVAFLSDAEQGAVDFVRSKMQLLNPNKFSL